MNTQDRAVVKALLQYMTDKCLTGSDEFRAALKHFNVTTTWQGKDIENDEVAEILGVKHNHIVNVFYPSRIDAYPHGERILWETKADADFFAAHERRNSDESVNQRVLDARALNTERLAANIEAAHAEALEMDAEFNFERVSREINTPECQSLGLDGDHTEALAMNQSRSETVRAVIAQALHVAANSFGHVIGEHQDLVETLYNAGYAYEAGKVDALFDELPHASKSHKVIRAAWRDALRRLSATL